METQATVGLSAHGHDSLRRLKEDGYFAEMLDAYRFAISLGIAHDMKSSGSGSRSTIFNVGSLDPDKTIYNTIRALANDSGESVYGLAEQYAEWGVAEMSKEAANGTLSLAALIQEAAEKYEQKS